jgi:methyltransferase (TIGR00027 family)
MLEWMKAGRASQTAVLVCTGRAIAHGTTSVARFSDPTAFALLPERARDQVERARAGNPPPGMRARIQHEYLIRQSKVMVARTVAIDDAVRSAASPQLVILGAGLDGRAWRMPELRDVTVFEVDHPDSQHDKRTRVAALHKSAREVRFVPVDFTRDKLEDALAAAGHDLTRPTTWVWEGVIMYLAPADVEATLAVVERRSAPRSRLVALYHSPALMLRVIGLVTRYLGEPLRSSFSAEAMRALLAKHSFTVVRDADVAELGAELSNEFGEATEIARHLRIAVADRL